MSKTLPHVREYAYSEEPLADDPHLEAAQKLLTHLWEREVPFASIVMRKIGMPDGSDYMVFTDRNNEHQAVYPMQGIMFTDGCEDYIIANQFMREMLGDGCPWRFKEPKDLFDEMLIVLRYYPQGHPELNNDLLIEREQEGD